MRVYAHRRTKLGRNASAALPRLWQEMDRRGWSDADLAREVAHDDGNIAKIVYGERKPGRSLSARFYARLGIGLELWDEPCPVRKRPHRAVTPDPAVVPHAKAG